MSRIPLRFERVLLHWRDPDFGQDGGEVVVEHEGSGVVRVLFPVHPAVARAKEAFGIVLGTGIDGGGFPFAQPGALGAMR